MTGRLYKIEKKKIEATKRALASTLFLSVLMSFVVVTATLVNAATTFTVSFDFDTGAPSLSTGQSIPFNQLANGVTAAFSSPSGSAFSVQTDDTTGYKLPQLSGRYLYDTGPYRDSLEIKFSHYLNSITLSFATVEYRGSSGDKPSNITLTAYIDSVATTPVGSAMSRGEWPSGVDSHPEGSLAFNSGSQQFNLVKIEVPYQGPRSAVDFVVDNVVVVAMSPSSSPSPSPSPTPSSSLPADSSPSPSPSSSPPVPEFPNAVILLVLIVATMLAVFLARKNFQSPGI